MAGKRSVTFGALIALIGSLLGPAGVGAQSQPTPAPQLPPGHPPMGGTPGAPTPGAPPMGGPMITPPAGDAGTGKNALKWTPPAAWTKQTPSSGMRRAQYKIGGPGGDAECVVFYFGPGQGGDTKGNVTRWIEQFRRPDGKPVADAKTREIKVGDIPVTMVEVAGTYVGGMGSAPNAERPNSMLLGAIADGPDAKWFFRATGPRATLEPQRGAFEKMIRSLKRGS
jgi:hypothetical protein